jgi:hypothetical protein
MLVRAAGTIVLTVIVLLLAGCGRHYWSRPGADAADFARDSGECARENALYRSGTTDFGIVLEDRYKACLTDRGWVRAQQLDPPPPGWFRGIEGDETVRFNPTPPR